MSSQIENVEDLQNKSNYYYVVDIKMGIILGLWCAMSCHTQLEFTRNGFHFFTKLGTFHRTNCWLIIWYLANC